MRISSADEAQKKIEAYLAGEDKKSYFVAADGDEYLQIKNKLTGLSTIRVGSFCYGEEVFPNFDELFDALKNLESESLCIGLGEAVLLTGKEQIIHRIRDRFFKKRIVVLCRGVKNILNKIAEDSPPFKRNLCIVESEYSFAVVKYSPELKVEVDARNFRELLTKLEEGVCGEVEVQTELELQNVRLLKSAYEAIKYKKPRFNVPREILSDKQWKEYLADDSSSAEPSHWRYYLRGFQFGFGNKYLNFISECSANFEEYSKNIFMALLRMDKGDRKFREYYDLRKELVKNLDEKFLSEYISAAQAKGADAVYYLTDNTPQECDAAIEAIQGLRKIPEVILENFSALEKYLGEYKFADERLTNYFRRYKKIKLCNLEDAEFKADVEKFARERFYNEFETRRTILDRLDKNSKLYWLDALSVEFLSYIERLADELELEIKIHVARADLPTLTSFNRKFFEDWQGEKFPKNEQLDAIKHSDKNSAAPLYICAELSIIDAVLKEIKNSLETQDAERIILTSDHGASRLAVIFGGKRLELSNAGEHGGRCCKVGAHDEKPDCAVAVNGYFIAANYARFKGGRLDSLEVHGGATLEEILIPIIEIAKGVRGQGSVVSEENGALNVARDGFDFFD